MKINALDEPTFLSTFIRPIQRLSTDSKPPLDFWPYFDAIPADDFAGHDCSAGQVDWVWRLADRYEHVLVNSTTGNVFMALVIGLQTTSVLGHRIVNFNELYGLESPSQ